MILYGQKVIIMSDFFFFSFFFSSITVMPDQSHGKLSLRKLCIYCSSLFSLFTMFAEKGLAHFRKWCEWDFFTQYPPMKVNKPWKTHFREILKFDIIQVYVPEVETRNTPNKARTKETHLNLIGRRFASYICIVRN